MEQDPIELFAQAVACWQASDELLKQSGHLLTQAEKFRKESVVKSIETSR